jgi:hypothetical protein
LGQGTPFDGKSTQAHCDQKWLILILFYIKVGTPYSTILVPRPSGEEVARENPRGGDDADWPITKYTKSVPEYPDRLPPGRAWFRTG